ncbi:hypothetical protein NA57DRAFT_61966 [Rhizodiscina lignyota]|uniref:Uncharacterized protein n=1 Tax=Rhizodiscina lignyota TaxID=1504668 RepID=A0A9P4M4S5_9PEZI|nr:hypothetical protein NA57DRAFT_61966 [Rhizodiscina lignyota]
MGVLVISHPVLYAYMSSMLLYELLFTGHAMHANSVLQYAVATIPSLDRLVFQLSPQAPAPCRPTGTPKNASCGLSGRSNSATARVYSHPTPDTTYADPTLPGTDSEREISRCEMLISRMSHLAGDTEVAESELRWIYGGARLPGTGESFVGRIPTTVSLAVRDHNERLA